MPDKRDMHQAKSHRNSRTKSQGNNRRGSSRQHDDGREAVAGGSGGARPAGPAHSGESTTPANPRSAATTVGTSGAPAPLGKKNRSRR